MSNGNVNAMKIIVALLIVLLPPFINWFANAMPTDRASLGFLGAAILSAVLAFLQKLQERKAFKKFKEAKPK